ncbi:unnamed protein product [Brachionus calyciflorus]|uniref:MULE transposase domain-containing protein n=1 Tax=Brachionus calyciflorus TaxID=104777 RepID=A0A814CIP8_9BILA|nr:unnamed protein product [Brachionus calyciflorus]
MAENTLENLIENFNQIEICPKIGKVTKSQKDKPQLALNGYFYRNYDKNGFKWRCINNKSYCHAKCETNVYSTIAPRQIISSVAGLETSKEAIATMPTYDADRQAVIRYKKKNLPNYPPEPKTPKEINFPEFLTKCLEELDGKDGKMFLIHDSGVENDDRFFVFSTAENMKLLQENNCFADGTFSIAPKLFCQIYTVHALIRGRCVPLVYCILPRKNESLYIRVLEVIENNLKISPKSITSDFEKAFLNTIWRKIQTIGLSGVYNESPLYSKILKLPQILAYIPPSDVLKMFVKIYSGIDKTIDHFDKIDEFFKYLEETWIGREEIKIRINDCLPRTNNFVEAWHNAFSNMLQKHPSIYQLVDKFRAEQKKSEEQLIRLMTGENYKRKPQYIILDERLREIAKMYSIDNFDVFYENLSLILN